MEFEWDIGNISKITTRFPLQEIEQFFVQELLVIRDDLLTRSLCSFVTLSELQRLELYLPGIMRTKEAKKYETFKKTF